MRNDIATLIKQHFPQDSIGVWQDPEETSREIFVEVKSASRAEYFKAAQIGNRCDYVFVVFSLDYEGENIIEWRGKRYEIYRTYHNTLEDTMELYAEERAGVTDGSKSTENQDNRSV